MINKNDEVFFRELVNEDNTGLVLRGHLHVEHQLIKFISHQLPYPDRIEWGRVGYTSKVELALSCGLEVDIRPGLVYLDLLRNNFVSGFDTGIDPQWVLVAYNGLPAEIKNTVEIAYKSLGKKINKGASTLDTRDLLVLIFICVANGIQAVIHENTGVVKKRAASSRTKKKSGVKRRSNKK